VKTDRLLLADRNRHVRELLRRELARDAQEILALLAQGAMPDLLILDLEIPYAAELKLLEQLQALYPTLPVLIHSFQPENPQELILSKAMAFLEKTEDPHQLKATIAELMHRQELLS
jgi:DNA-binding NarL/FixJ family response regulator